MRPTVSGVGAALTMALSRRAFLSFTRGRRPSETPPPPASAPVSPTVIALGREAGDPVPLPPPLASSTYLASTENRLGPGPRARAALEATYGGAPTTTGRTRRRDADLRSAVATHHGVDASAVILGAGSSEILRNATRAFTSASAPLVTASPSFAICAATARHMGTPVRDVGLLPDLGLNLDDLAAAGRGAGLIYVCNPNNPTGTLSSSHALEAFVARMRMESPGTTILVDEAYSDYVTDATYASAVPLAANTPGLVVTRTFSKAHGLAGLRVGYAVAHADVVKTLTRFAMPYGLNPIAIGPTIAALADGEYLATERRRNLAARTRISDRFTHAGLTVAHSEANFICVRVGMAAGAFRHACAARGVIVGRDFAPIAEAGWTRVSVGTHDDMERAWTVFEEVLQVAARDRGSEEGGGQE